MESIHLPTEFLRPKRGAKDRALQLSPRRVLVRALKMHIDREMDVYRGGDDTTAGTMAHTGQIKRNARAPNESSHVEFHRLLRAASRRRRGHPERKSPVCVSGPANPAARPATVKLWHPGPPLVAKLTAF